MEFESGIGLLQAGIDKMPHEVAILDTDGTIVACNEAWRQFADDNHGIHPDYWVGENYFEICEQSDDRFVAEEVVTNLQAVLRGDKEQYQYEYPCHSPEEHRWFRLDAAGFVLGERSYLLVSHTNITDRMVAEIQATARSEQLKTVLQVLQHDLRNPLNIINGYAEMLATELEDNHEIQRIQQAAARIGEITEATLAFSESGELSDVESLSVGKLARSAWQTVATKDATLTITDSHLWKRC